MFSFIVISYLTLQVATLHLPNLSDQMIGLVEKPSGNANVIQPSTPPNASALGAGKLYVECSGDKYGGDLILADCENTKSMITFDSRQFQWAVRHTPEFRSESMFPLPYRLMGGMLRSKGIW